jgi:20S proteasome alpha/beta subunit
MYSSANVANKAVREVLLGITGKDFTLIAASKASVRGPTVLKANDDKTRALNKHSLLAYSGEAGDTGTCLPLFPRLRIAQVRYEGKDDH